MLLHGSLLICMHYQYMQAQKANLVVFCIQIGKIKGSFALQLILLTCKISYKKLRALYIVTQLKSMSWCMLYQSVWRAIMCPSKRRFALTLQHSTFMQLDKLYICCHGCSCQEITQAIGLGEAMLVGYHVNDGSNIYTYYHQKALLV